MIATEQEARQSWACPWAMMQAPSGAYNRENVSPARLVVGCKCLGADCGGWRWWEDVALTFLMARDPELQATWDALGEDDDPPERPDHVPASYDFVYQDGEPAGWVEPFEQANLRRRGYCGPSGRPVLP